MIQYVAYISFLIQRIAIEESVYDNLSDPLDIEY